MSLGPGPAQGVSVLWWGLRGRYGQTDICVQITPANYVQISLEFRANRIYIYIYSFPGKLPVLCLEFQIDHYQITGYRFLCSWN